MPESKQIVINTGPVLALIAALGNLEILKLLFNKVWVPFEVQNEISSFGIQRFGAKEFYNAKFLFKETKPIVIPPILMNTLDIGEAAVIQLAVEKKISTVCIDEVAGRRVARLYDLKLTGSIGILLKAKKDGYPISMVDSIKQMKEKGIYMSRDLEDFALKFSGENM